MNKKTKVLKRYFEREKAREHKQKISSKKIKRAT